MWQSLSKLDVEGELEATSTYYRPLSRQIIKIR